MVTCTGCRAAKSGRGTCGTPGPTRPGCGRVLGRPAPFRFPPRRGSSNAVCRLAAFMENRIAYIFDAASEFASVESENQGCNPSTSFTHQHSDILSTFRDLHGEIADDL